MPMRGHGNVTGADVVMRWTTGYPVRRSTCRRGYPRFNPGEFSTVDLLVRGDNDAALVLGADPGATMPQPAIDHLARIPTIVLDPKVTHTSRLARVHITTAVTGISAPGTVVPHGRDPAAAAAGAEVAVSDRRRGHPPHLAQGRSARQAAPWHRRHHRRDGSRGIGRCRHGIGVIEDGDLLLPSIELSDCPVQ